MIFNNLGERKHKTQTFQVSPTIAILGILSPVSHTTGQSSLRVSFVCCSQG